MIQWIKKNWGDTFLKTIIVWGFSGIIILTGVVISKNYLTFVERISHKVSIPVWIIILLFIVTPILYAIGKFENEGNIK